jgi:hypothetical protein
MRGIVVDRRGKAWPADSAELARKLGCRQIGDDVASYAVRERACIYVVQRANGARVALSLGRFTQKGLLGALLALDSIQPRILLSAFDGGQWSNRMFSNLARFAEYAETVAEDEPLGRREPWLATPLQLEALSQPSLAKLEPLFLLWRASRGWMSEEVGSLLDQVGLRQRTTIARQLPRSERLVFETVATGLTVMRPCEWLERVGRDIGDLPDPAYGANSYKGYFDVAYASAPRLETVRAVCRTSAGATMRSSYDRLLLPWRRGRNDLLVLAVSTLRAVHLSERRFANDARDVRH